MINKHLGEGYFALLDKKEAVLFIKNELNPQKISSDKQERFIIVQITHQNKKNIDQECICTKRCKIQLFKRNTQPYNYSEL